MTQVIASYYPHADAPGLAPVRRGFFVVRLINQAVSVSPQVKRTASRPRLRMHGRLTRRRHAFGLATEPSAPLPAFRVSRENTNSRSLLKAARETPSLAACIARRSVPSMRVTSGPGVPTGGSLPHATASNEHLPPQTNGSTCC